MISNNHSNNGSNNNIITANQVHNKITVQYKIPFSMEFLILKGLRKVSSIMRPQFSTKFHFKWIFYGKLILKRCLDAEDWFHNKIAVQHKIPFRMNLKL